MKIFRSKRLLTFSGRWKATNDTGLQGGENRVRQPLQEQQQRSREDSGAQRYRESFNSLYQAYRNHCIDTNEYVRSTANFYTALEGTGFDRIKVKNKRFIKGVRLKVDDADGEDFLN